MFEGIYNKMTNRAGLAALTKRAIMRDGTIATGRDEHHGPLPVDISNYRPRQSIDPYRFIPETKTIDDAGGASISVASFPRFGLYGGDAE